MGRLHVCGFVAISCCATLAAAAAPPLAIRVIDDPASDCPSARVIERELARLVPDVTFLDDDSFDAKRVRLSDNGDTYLVAFGGTVREFKDPERRCSERARAAAIFLAMALDPSLVPTPIAPATPPEPAPEPPPAPAPAPPPPPAPPLIIARPIVPRPATSRVQLFTGGASWWSSSSRAFSSDGIGGGLGDASITIYLKPLVDNAAPRSLQPFLQRATSFQLWGGAMQAITTHSSQPIQHAWFSASATGYVGRLYLSGGVGGEVTPERRGSDFVVSPVGMFRAFFGVGVRLGHVLLDASYGIEPYLRHDWVIDWGYVRVGVRAVVARRVNLWTSIRTRSGGFSADSGVSIHPTRDFGVHLGVGGGHGVLFLTELPHRTTDEVYGYLGFSYWFARGFGTSIGYTPRWLGSGANERGVFDGSFESGAADELRHTISFSFFSRI